MENLANDLVLEIMKRLDCKDAVSLGATSKEYNAIRKRGQRLREIRFHQRDCLLYRAHKMLTYHFRSIIRRMPFPADPPEDGSDIFGAGIEYDFIRCSILGTESGTTTARYDKPSRWETDVMLGVLGENVGIGMMPPFINVYLDVQAGTDSDLNAWSFSFHAELIDLSLDMGDHTQELYALFQQKEIRCKLRNACAMLLASWYHHARCQMGRMKLRSHASKRQEWLPEQLPPFHRYIHAAYEPVMRFLFPPAPAPAVATQQ